MVNEFRAIRVLQFGEPDVLRLTHISIDITPSPTQVVVKLSAAGVNPVDTYIRSGHYSRLPELPYTPGNDGAGVITAVGTQVEQFKVGDRVFVCRSETGTYAEYCLCEQEHVAILPAKISFRRGAAIGTSYLTAHRALIVQGQAQSGERLLIHGASGGVGLACLQIAKSLGMYVIATAGSEQGRKLLQEQGADMVLDHNADFYLDNVVAVNICVEMLANVNLLADVRVMEHRGRIVVVGNRGAIDFNPRDIMVKELHIVGVMLHRATQEEFKQSLVFVTSLLDNGALPTVGEEFPLADAAMAHRVVAEHAQGARGKVVLHIGEESV